MVEKEQKEESSSSVVEQALREYEAGAFPRDLMIEVGADLIKVLNRIDAGETQEGDFDFLSQAHQLFVGLTKKRIKEIIKAGVIKEAPARVEERLDRAFTDFKQSKREEEDCRRFAGELCLADPSSAAAAAFEAITKITKRMIQVK